MKLITRTSKGGAHPSPRQVEPISTGTLPDGTLVTGGDVVRHARHGSTKFRITRIERNALGDVEVSCGTESGPRKGHSRTFFLADLIATREF